MLEIEMEVHLHLKNGVVDLVKPRSLESMRMIVTRIHDSRFFEWPSVTIAAQESVVVYSSSVITRIDVLMDAIPSDWNVGGQRHATVCEIAEAGWRDRSSLPRHLPHQATILCLMRLVDGTSAFLKIEPNRAGTLESRQFFRNVFALRQNAACCRLGGGLSVWNPAHVISCEFYPSLQTPSTAWHAECLGEAHHDLTTRTLESHRTKRLSFTDRLDSRIGKALKQR